MEVLTMQALWTGTVNFPWTKLLRVMRFPEVWMPQVEDGVTADGLTVEYLQQRGTPTCLFMDGPKTLGFVALESHGRVWTSMHVGFKPGVPGYVKRSNILYAMMSVFETTETRKLTGMVPEFNKPARWMARQCFMQPTGRVTKAFLRDGKLCDLVVYGVSKDEFPIRQLAFSREQAHIPAEQSEFGPN